MLNHEAAHGSAIQFIRSTAGSVQLTLHRTIHLNKTALHIASRWRLRQRCTDAAVVTLCKVSGVPLRGCPTAQYA